MRDFLFYAVERCKFSKLRIIYKVIYHLNDSVKGFHSKTFCSTPDWWPIEVILQRAKVLQIRVREER
jgi:hypothetical protein